VLMLSWSSLASSAMAVPSLPLSLRQRRAAGKRPSH